MAKLRICYTRLRTEEKLLFQAAEKKGIPFEAVNIRSMSWPDELDCDDDDIIICRCVSHTQNLALARLFEGRGLRTVNHSSVMSLCGDKVATASLFRKMGIPQPDFKVAFSEEGAVEATEKMGYPSVLKPPTGSWGRLLAKVNDRDAAEAVCEHKSYMGSQHQVYFIQEFIEKKGYDLRATVIGGEPVSMIKRSSEHWITNTARGATAEGVGLDAEAVSLLKKVASATGGDFLAIDLFESEKGLLVNEINGQPEFRSSIHTTGVDIPSRILEYAWSLADNPERGL